MTPSQEKALENFKRYDSYKKHWEKNGYLIVECEFEYKGRLITYIVSIGKRGGKTTIYP